MSTHILLVEDEAILAMAEARMLEAWVNRERATEDLELQTGTFLSLGLMINEIATNVIKHGFETAG